MYRPTEVRVYVASGSVTFTNDKIVDNTASFFGGGVYIAAGASVDLDAFTLANTENNSLGNIIGTYTLIA